MQKLFLTKFCFLRSEVFGDDASRSFWLMFRGFDVLLMFSEGFNSLSYLVCWCVGQTFRKKNESYPRCFFCTFSEKKKGSWSLSYLVC
jgi:hypothetical protein